MLKNTASFFLFLLHVIFWLAFYLVPFVDPRGIHAVHKSMNPNFFFDIHLLINHALFIFLFYFNSNFLIPKFLKKARKIEYTLILFFLFITILTISYIIFPFLSFFPAHFNISSSEPSASIFKIVYLFILFFFKK